MSFSSCLYCFIIMIRKYELVCFYVRVNSLYIHKSSFHLYVYLQSVKTDIMTEPFFSISV